MSESGGVGVAWPDIRTQLRKNGDGFVYITLDLDGCTNCTPALLNQIAQAIDLANAAMVLNDEELAAAFDPIPSPIGPIIKIDWPGDDETTTQTWLHHLTDTLTSIGHTGTVKAAPTDDLPRAIGNNLDPHPTALLAYTLTNPLAPISNKQWLLEETFAEETCHDAATWVTAPGGDLYFAEGIFEMRVGPADLADLMNTTIKRSYPTRATSVTHSLDRAHSALLGKDGVVTFGVIEPTDRWRDRLPDLKAQLLRAPAMLDIGVIRSSRSIAFGWGFALDASPQGLASISDGGAWDVNRHLWSRFVPDAHAIQVLTRDHLDRANNLSNWRVTALEGDRYLVETPDLDAWYTNAGAVDDDVLNQARADFGDMIITEDAIRADPLGWLGGPRPPERA